MRREPLVIALLFTATYALTFSHFVNGFIHDEFRALDVVNGIREYGVPVFLDRNYYQHPPLLYIAILVPSYVLPVDLAGMVVELACAFGTLLAFYLLAETLISRKAAIFGTAILGTHPNLWIWSNRFLHEAPLLLFFTASLYLFTVAMRTGKRTHWLLLGLLLSLGFNLKVSTLLVVPIIVVHMSMSKRILRFSKGVKLDLKDVERLLAAGLVALAIYAPYFIYTQVNNAPSQTQIFSREIAGAAAFTLPEPWYFYITEFPNFMNIALFLLFVYGLAAVLVDRNVELMRYLVWFVIPVIFFTIPLYKVYRYVNPMFPVLVLFAAYGINTPPHSIMNTLRRRRANIMKKRLSCMRRNIKKIEASYDFIWSLRERFPSWGTVGDALAQAKTTGVTAALFVKSLDSGEERFTTDTRPELEIDLNKEIGEIMAGLKTDAKVKVSKETGMRWFAPLICVLVASFGAYQSLSTVLYDGEWPAHYQAWDTLNSLDSNGVILAHNYWWAINFFTDNFVEYLSGNLEYDYDLIAQYNARYIVTDPGWDYVSNSTVFELVEPLPELDATIYRVNWTELENISSYIPFEISVNREQGGLNAAWVSLGGLVMGRTTSDGTYRGFLPDNTVVTIGLQRICYEPETANIKVENGTVYSCTGMWLECTQADTIDLNMEGRSCLYHPEFVLDRF